MPALRLVLTLCALLVLPAPSRAADRYAEASVDDAGDLRIVTSDGRAIVVRKEPEQVGFDRIAISQDGRSVGWLAMYPNCCTSYPIPLKLVVTTRHGIFDLGLSLLVSWVARAPVGS